MNGLLIFILFPLVVAAAAALLKGFAEAILDVLAVASSFILFALSLAAYYFVSVNGAISVGLGGFEPPLGINLVLDRFSGLFLIIISFIALMIMIFSVDYMKKFTSKAMYYCLAFLLFSGLYGIVLTGDLFSLYLFVELVAISSVCLVAFGCEAEELEAAFKYLILGTIASFLILLAIAFIYSVTGGLCMAHVALSLGVIGKSSAMNMCSVLLLSGLFVKAALVPFHSWLPDAHPAAPAPVSAILSGVVVKVAGVYILCRLIFNVFGITALFSETLMFAGIFSIIVGSAMAMGQWDLKRLFAYSTISQVGYIVFGIGLATPLGVAGALFHLFNHSAMKSLLFLNAGSIEYSTGERDLRKMGGLKQRLPVTYFTSLMASLSVAGVPPFAGFFSKFIIIVAAIISKRYVYAMVALLASVVTLAYMLRAQKFAFLGELKSSGADIKEAPRLMRFVMITLMLVVIAGGLLFPWVIFNLIDPAMKALMEGVTTYSGMIIGG